MVMYTQTTNKVIGVHNITLLLNVEQIDRLRINFSGWQYGSCSLPLTIPLLVHKVILDEFRLVSQIQVSSLRIDAFATNSRRFNLLKYKIYFV